MASITDICNLAVANLGHRAVITAVFPVPDGSQEAALCNRFYSLARDTVLELHEWGFATKRVTLADLGTPPTGWLYRYAMPANVIHPLRIVEYGGTAETPFAIESDDSGTVLLSNYSPAELHYTARIEDTTKYSPTFVLSTSWMLASFIANPLTSDLKLAAFCEQKARLLAGDAATRDANATKAKAKDAISTAFPINRSLYPGVGR